MLEERVNSNLGIEENIDGVTIDELIKNKTALKMLLHNYQKINSENEMLKQDLNRQATFERGLDKKSEDAKIATILNFVGTLAIGGGTNFITNDINNFPGWVLLFLGIVLSIIGIYYSLRGGHKNV